MGQGVFIRYFKISSDFVTAVYHAVNRAYRVIKFILTEPSNKGQRLKRLFAGIFWQVWKRVIKIALVLTFDNSAKFIAYPDEVCCSFPIYVRIYESPYITFLRSYLKNK